MTDPFGHKVCPKFYSYTKYNFGQNFGQNNDLKFVTCEQALKVQLSCVTFLTLLGDANLLRQTYILETSTSGVNIMLHL